MTRKAAPNAAPSAPSDELRLTLVSHHLCPYVQRAAIALSEKGVEHERIDIDLANKPDWFAALSPLGKTPVLRAGEAAIFESAVILEYLEETRGNPLHPADPIERARHRGWIEYASAVLNDIARLYAAPDAEGFAARALALRDRFARLEDALGAGPWFAGRDFSLVDAAFGPVFRYFDVLDGIGDFAILRDLPKIAGWRAGLAARPSVRRAVAPDYPERLAAFFAGRGSHLSTLVAGAERKRHESLDGGGLSPYAARTEFGALPSQGPVTSYERRAEGPRTRNETHVARLRTDR